MSILCIRKNVRLCAVYSLIKSSAVFITDIFRYYIAGLTVLCFFYACLKKFFIVHFIDSQSSEGFSSFSLADIRNDEPRTRRTSDLTSRTNDQDGCEPQLPGWTLGREDVCVYCNEPLIVADYANDSNQLKCAFERPAFPNIESLQNNTHYENIATYRNSVWSFAQNNSTMTVSDMQSSTTDLFVDEDPMIKSDARAFKVQNNFDENSIVIIITTLDRQLSTTDLNPEVLCERAFPANSRVTSCDKQEDTSDLEPNQRITSLDAHTSTTELDCNFFSSSCTEQTKTCDRQVSTTDLELSSDSAQSKIFLNKQVSTGDLHLCGRKVLLPRAKRSRSPSPISESYKRMKQNRVEVCSRVLNRSRSWSSALTKTIILEDKLRSLSISSKLYCPSDGDKEQRRRLSMNNSKRKEKSDVSYGLAMLSEKEGSAKPLPRGAAGPLAPPRLVAGSICSSGILRKRSTESQTGNLDYLSELCEVSGSLTSLISAEGNSSEEGNKSSANLSFEEEALFSHESEEDIRVGSESAFSEDSNTFLCDYSIIGARGKMK